MAQETVGSRDGLNEQVIVITGAANGIGRAFLEHYSSLPNTCIYATDVRWAPDAVYANETSRAKVELATFDITSEESVNKFVAGLVNQGKRVDTVIHCVGVRGLVPAIVATSDVVDDSETLHVMTAETMMKTYEINVIGTFLLLRALIPLLKQRATDTQDTNDGTTALQSRVVVMGSRMGSLTMNKTGSAYAYRPSKAALNQLLRSFSIDLASTGIRFLTIHPGRVESNLVHIKEEGAIPAATAVHQMLPLIEDMSVRETGLFLFRDGSVIEW